MPICVGWASGTSAMDRERPNRAYYRSVAGRWSGDLDLAITDWELARYFERG